jgi:site-specific DNA-adenine methylase
MPRDRLRPFFCYFGGKWREALKSYPEPRYGTIIEPFAGAAGFAARYATRKVILCEIDPIIAAVWRYLIKVTAKEILSLPDLVSEETVDNLIVSQEAKWLIGFWLNKGTSGPRKSPSTWMRSNVRPKSYWGAHIRQILASQVDSIRHWEIHNCSYVDCPTPLEATWFVDPPYEVAGQAYRFGSKQIDYQHLGDWCQTRPGQVIVCENEGATWLPFQDLASVKASPRSIAPNRRSKEVCWLSTFEEDAYLQAFMRGVV